jgi:LPS export ABC transporter protein LptC
MWKWLLASLIFILIVIELVFFAPRPGDRQVEKDWESPVEQTAEKDVEQILRGSHLIEAKGEKKLWELDADVARKKMNSEDFSLDEVKVKFYGENKVYYDAVGDHGYVEEGQKKLKISGDTVTTSSNGYVLKTEVIYYRTDNRTIDGPTDVKLKGPPDQNGDGGPLHLRADRFDANLNSNIINLKDNVRGNKTMSGGRQMKIQSREALVSGASNFVLFKKDVVIDVDTMTVTGPRAKFIYKEGDLHSVFIDGGVKVKDIGRWGVAGEAEVFVQEDKFVFRDNPKVVEGKNQLVGSEIIAYDGGDRIVVRKGSTRYNTGQQPGAEKQ